MARRSTRRPPPDDFVVAVKNGLSNAELCARYGVGKTKLCEWKQECGVAAEPAVAPRVLVHTRDTQETINLCLTCKRANCTGSCCLVRHA